MSLHSHPFCRLIWQLHFALQTTPVVPISMQSQPYGRLTWQLHHALQSTPVVPIQCDSNAIPAQWPPHLAAASCRVPEECPQEVADLIAACRNNSPAPRPTAQQVLAVLQGAGSSGNPHSPMGAANPGQQVKRSADVMFCCKKQHPIVKYAAPISAVHCDWHAK